MTPQQEWDKKVRRLVEDPDGRAALQRVGINVELVADKPKDKPVVVILCPTYRAPEPQMQDALGAMVKYTREKDIATVYAGPPLSSSVVHWSRNGLITEHLKSGKPWTHVLFIDDDIVVEPDALEKLLSHKKEIVAGLCTRRTDPPIPNARYFDEKTGDFQQIWEWPNGKLLEVGAVGTGFMLISKHALEQVGQAYWDCKWEQEFYGLEGMKLQNLKTSRLSLFDETKICYWFRFLPALGKAIEYGEDISFCFMAKRYCDIQTFVDTSIQPGHLGNYGYSIRDFRPYRDECILRAKLAGDYKMEIPEFKISILCPTRGRLENMKRLVASLSETSTIEPELVVYADEDDATSYHEIPCKLIRGPRITLSECWNKCAEVATGEILMHAGDDIVFKTKGWDTMVRRAFATFPDRMVFVHGDDCFHGNRFGTHGFLHRRWIETTGYFCPPYFSSDYNDTWFNDVFNALDRRIFMPFVTEHMHPLAGKGEWDQTHKDRLERHKKDEVDTLYKSLAGKRMEDIAKVSQILGTNYEEKKLILA